LVYKLGVEQERINQHRDAINRSYDDFLSIYENDRYFSKRDLNKWLKENEATKELIDEYINHEKKAEPYNKITKILQPMLNVKPLDDNFRKKVLYLQNIFENGNDLRQKRNSYYVEGELEKYSDFFNKVCSKPLSEEQRRIIVTDEAHNLVVAGAGTGKTLTIIGKTGYLLKKGIAEPDDLLLLSFAKKVKDELKTRINKRLHVEPEVRTFHSLGLEITRQTLGYDLHPSDLGADARNRTKTVDTLIQPRKPGTMTTTPSPPPHTHIQAQPPRPHDAPQRKG
jgi:hypothetical protein